MPAIAFGRLQSDVEFNEACVGKLTRALGRTPDVSEEIAVLTILETNGIEDAIWCMRAADDTGELAARFACKTAMEVHHRMSPVAQTGFAVASAYLKGQATREDLVHVSDLVWKTEAGTDELPVKWTTAAALEAVQCFADARNAASQDVRRAGIRAAWEMCVMASNATTWITKDPVQRKELKARQRAVFRGVIESHRRVHASKMINARQPHAVAEIA